ncbi:hypothetical protein ENUP19_0099G0034 [Entamoeba nuttalli]|uniref:Uncharacterized protein n=2 Tax=Entamoeba nuttalli TaxID=412467 RepID=K2H0R1_ENTNP|nr:hypothetical protein ENU1_113210 [Entamoeba nuttalli P19]EKE39842.1 hypothetical protein ENU1_113210 [Entamoeba nuttalli P19]|eukprot:XP_008857843.1 hypothetical protein ENU1_113210 [Entamoeba nuttalli P19]
MKRYNPCESPEFNQNVDNDDSDLPDFLREDNFPEQRNTARFQLPQSILLSGISIKNEPYNNTEYSMESQRDILKEERYEIKEDDIPLQMNTIADEITNRLENVIEDNKYPDPFGEVVWELQKCVTQIKENMPNIQKVDYRKLTQTLNETLYQLFKRVVSDSLCNNRIECRDLQCFFSLSKDISRFEIFNREEVNKLNDLIAKIEDITPQPQVNNITNQQELRSYLNESGLNTTQILIQICDPKDVGSFIKALGDLKIIFSASKHSKTNYISMIKELNGLDDDNGRKFATPFFLLKKAFECCVIKSQFKALVEVLSQAILNMDFFTDDQREQVDKMLNQADSFRKSKPELLGKKLQLKKDEEVMKFGYVRDYIERHPELS